MKRIKEHRIGSVVLYTAYTNSEIFKQLGKHRIGNKTLLHSRVFDEKKNYEYIKTITGINNEGIPFVYVNLSWYKRTKEDVLSVLYNTCNEGGMELSVFNDVYQHIEETKDLPPLNDSIEFIGMANEIYNKQEEDLIYEEILNLFKK
jgi:hypothetical protein